MVESCQRGADPTAVEQQSVWTLRARVRPIRDRIGWLVDAGAGLALDARSGGVIALRRSGRHWNALGQRDALASILTRADDDPGWDLDEFFETGRADVAQLMVEIERLLPGLQTGTNVPGFEYWVTTRSSGDFQRGHAVTSSWPRREPT